MGQRILIFGLGDLYSLGGVQVSYQHLIAHLVERGHDVIFYSHREHNPDASYAYTFPQSVKIHHYRLGETQADRRVIKEAVRTYDPTVILVVLSGQACLPLLRALSPLPYPVVLSERGGDRHNLQYNWFSREQRAFAHYLADNTHFLMESYKGGLPAWMAPQITCIPSLIEPAVGDVAAPDRAGENGRFRIVYAGRLAFEKDVDILISAFAGVAEELPEWELHICGDGPDEKMLRHLASSILPAGAADRVIFRGALTQTQLFEEYRRGHLFVLPSRNEGCPLALREAMAYGLPVIGFDTASGVNEIIEHGHNGLLAGSSDKVSELRSALLELMRAPDRRRIMGRAGMTAIIRYTPEIVLTAWERLLVDTAAIGENRRDARRRRYKGVAATSRMREYRQSLKAVPQLRNLYVFDRALAGNRWDEIDLPAYALCFGSCLFDPMWYGRTYFETKLAGLDPLAHYLSVGHRIGYEPSADFDSAFYRQHHMDQGSNEAPLVHFLRAGRYYGADTQPMQPSLLANRILHETKSDGTVLAALEDPALAASLSGNEVKWLTWKRHVRDYVVDRAAPFIAPRKAMPSPLLSERGPTVSVVVPVYNKELYVRDAIESVGQQSYPALEIIAVDDGSTDSSPDILLEAAARTPAVKVIRQTNMGLSVARNTGIEAASGDYIFFHDADDLMEVDGLTHLVQAAVRSGSDVVGGVFNRRTAQSERVVQTFKHDRHRIDFRRSPRDAHQHSTNFSSCNKMFRRSFLLEHDLRFVPGLYMQDIDFWLRVMFTTNSFTQIDVAVSTYCLREGSWSGQKSEARFESLFRLYEGLDRYYAAHDLGAFAQMRNHALIQGAMNFFVKWKLEDWSVTDDDSDLERLRQLLARMPEDDIVSFFVEKNKSPIAPIFLLVKRGDYRLALQILREAKAQSYRNLLQRTPHPSADDLVNHSRTVVSTVAAAG